MRGRQASMYSILISDGYPVADQNADFNSRTPAPNADIPDTGRIIDVTDEVSDEETKT